MRQIVSKEGMSMEEFIRLSETEGPFELINGEIIYMSPTVFGHSHIVRLLFDVLHRLPHGETYSETAFVLPGTDMSQWVKGSRIPDVMYIKQGRLDEYKANTPDWRERPLMLVPDVVIEVVSSGDSYSDVQKKVDAYLADGVQMVLVVDPSQQNIMQWTQEDPKRGEILTTDHTLSGGEVIPGFELPLSVIFD